MRRCTSAVRLDFPAHVVALFAPTLRLEDHDAFCELGEGHDEDHADLISIEDPTGPDRAVWARWKQGTARLASLDWCQTENHKEDACGLFADHPAAHGWDVRDLLKEAQALALERESQRRHRHPQSDGT